MSFNIISFIKTMLAGAGAGFALTGGLSIAIPAITVTNSIALSMAGAGAAVLAVIYLKKKLVG